LRGYLGLRFGNGFNRNAVAAFFTPATVQSQTHSMCPPSIVTHVPARRYTLGDAFQFLHPFGLREDGRAIELFGDAAGIGMERVARGFVAQERSAVFGGESEMNADAEGDCACDNLLSHMQQKVALLFPNRSTILSRCNPRPRNS